MLVFGSSSVSGIDGGSTCAHGSGGGPASGAASGALSGGGSVCSTRLIPATTWHATPAIPRTAATNSARRLITMRSPCAAHRETCRGLRRDRDDRHLGARSGGQYEVRARRGPDEAEWNGDVGDVREDERAIGGLRA